MDELTTGFLRRQLRLKGPILCAMAAGSLVVGLFLPREELVNVAALLFLLTGWLALGWTASDRTEGPMAAILAAPQARRPWLVAGFTTASLVSGLVCFAALLPTGFRPALVAGLLALAYGWMAAVLGLALLLRVSRPREVHWIAGVSLGVLLMIPTPLAGAMKGTAWVWHPISLFKFGLSQSLSLSGGSHGTASVMGTLWDLPLQGVMLPLMVSLFAWRWTLRALDRLEITTQ